MRTLLATAAVLLAAGGAQGAPYLYDMGTGTSQLWPGFARVTAESIYADAAGFGWKSAEGLKAVAQAYTAPVDNPSRGRAEQPPIWTNAITEDTILGDRENTFLIK